MILSMTDFNHTFSQYQQHIQCPTLIIAPSDSDFSHGMSYSKVKKQQR